MAALSPELQKRIKEYKKEGYTDSDIVNHLKETKSVLPARVDAYRKEGWSDEQIVHRWLTGTVLPQPNIPKSTLRGTAVGAAQIAGAPSDILEGMTNTIAAQKSRQFGEPPPAKLDVPLGSDTFKAGINKLAGDDFAYDSLEDLPSQDRPFAAAGEVMGGNVVLGGGIGAAAKMGGLGRVGEAIRKSPKQIAAVEAGSTLGAMQGAAIGEAVDPGGYGRIIGEIGGGYLNPIGTLYRAGAKTTTAAWNWIQTLTPSGRADRAAVLLRGALEEAGEDPGEIAAALKKRGITVRRDGVTRPLNLTSAQRTGSPTLLRLEAELKRNSSKFGQESSRRMEDAMDDIQYMIAALSESEDPSALKLAAELRANYIDSVIQARLDLIKNKATEARARFPQVKDSSVPSAEAYKTLDNALEEARAIETAEYWDKVDKSIEVEDISDFVNSYENLKKSRLKVRADKMPDLISQQIRRMKLISGDLGDEVSEIMAEKGASRQDAVAMARSARQKELNKGPLDTGELITFRSRMLAESRKARAAQDWDSARLYEGMADATLRAMDNINAPGYEQARDFSRRLHETFSKTFAGDALATSKQGGERISPELMLIRAFSGGKEKGALQFAELEDAVRFSNMSMLEQQEEFPRNAALASRKDGVFNPKALQTFMENNPEMLNRFPNLARDLKDVQKAERVLAGYEKKLKPSYRMRVRAALEQLIEGEDSTKYVDKILRGNTPQKDYAELVKTARRGGRGAVEGLKTATLDTAWNRAYNSADDSLNMTEYKKALFDPVSTRGPSPADIMVREGIMTKREKILLKRWVEQIEKAQHSLLTGAELDELMQSDGLFDLAVRVTGARIGARLGEGGSSLLAASRGSEYARKLFEKVPASRMRDVLIEASENPQIMAMLLERKPSPKRKAEIAKRIRVWLANSGLTAPAKMEDSEMPELPSGNNETRFTPLPVMP